MTVTSVRHEVCSGYARCRVRCELAPFCPPQEEVFWIFPRDGMLNISRSFTAGWELDRKVGSRLFDGMG